MWCGRIPGVLRKQTVSIREGAPYIYRASSKASKENSPNSCIDRKVPFFFIGALGKQNLQIMLAEVSAAAFMTWNAQGPS
jgi:hypothetical protein